MAPASAEFVVGLKMPSTVRWRYSGAYTLQICEKRWAW